MHTVVYYEVIFMVGYHFIMTWGKQNNTQTGVLLEKRKSLEYVIYCLLVIVLIEKESLLPVMLLDASPLKSLHPDGKAWVLIEHQLRLMYDLLLVV